MLRPAIAMLLVLAAPAAAKDDKPAPPQLQGRVIGKPVPCVQTSQIERTDRVTDQVILFHMRGRRIYRNDLPAACPRLSRPGTVISYSVPINSLCRGDIIRLSDAGASFSYASCGLGPFTPYELPPKRKP